MVGQDISDQPVRSFGRILDSHQNIGINDLLLEVRVLALLYDDIYTC